MAWNTSNNSSLQQIWRPYEVKGTEPVYSPAFTSEYATMNISPWSLQYHTSNQISESSSQCSCSFDSIDPHLSIQLDPSLGFESVLEGNQSNKVIIRDPSPNHSSGANSKSSSLLCTWEECKRPGPFCNKGTLKRHIKTQHISPQSFKCPYSDCTMSFNRKDNLDQHLRSNVHWKNV